MKRLIMLAVLCAFVLSAAAASASDLKASGYFKSDAVWQTNWDFVDGNGDDSDTQTFDLAERIEVNFDFIANENLKAVVTLRHGTNTFGDSEIGLGGTGDFAVRKAYVDFNIPGSEANVKVGHMGLALPNAIGGSLLLDSRASAVLVSSPLAEGFALTGAFIRAARGAEDADGDWAMGNEDQLDLWALIADITVADANIKPFFVLGNAGQNNATFGQNATTGKLDSAYWLGVSATMGFGDINVATDINYGAINTEEDLGDASGWALLLSGEYAGLDMMTPEAYFVYTTGEDDDASNGSERMPTIAGDWAIGSFFFGGDAWLNGSINADVDATNLGFWALGVTVKDIASFADGLFHYATVIYAMGTNDEDATGLTYGKALTEKDSLIEIDFNTYYKLYDEMTVGIELGYVNLMADEDVWAEGDGGSAYKISTGLKYSF